jgi:Holliday junction resolvase-like predicted endonuclease
MNIERELIIAVLKATKTEVASLQVVSKEAKIPFKTAQNIMEKLQKDGLIYLRDDFLEASSLQRLKLAVHAIQLGADIERVANYLQWQEFEQIAVIAFERNGYSVTRNLRFTQGGRKWEIDIVACKKPLAVCVDCKHWHKSMYPSVLKKIVDEQVERTLALAETITSIAEKIHCTSWTSIKLVPAVLSLVTGRFKFYDNVPIVSVLQIQDFLAQLPAYTETLKHFTMKLAD